jgi:hypothetical protein
MIEPERERKSTNAPHNRITSEFKPTFINGNEEEEGHE